MAYVSNDPRVRLHRRSSLSSWRRCRVRHEYESSNPAAVSANVDALERGTGFHAVVEDLLARRVGRVSGSPPPQEIAAAVARCLESGEVTPATEQEVRMLLERWAEQYPLSVALDVELLLSSLVLPSGQSPDGLEHRVGGRLDLVTAPNVVWDWKTAYRVPTQSELQRDLQVISYAIMASDHYGWESVTVAVQFVRWGVTRFVEFDAAALAEASRVLAVAVAEFLAWESSAAAMPDEPTPGRHCEGCPLLARCEVASPDCVQGDRDARELAAALGQSERRGRRLRAMLRDWLAARPGAAVEVDGEAWSIELRGGWSVDDVEGLVGRLSEAGLPFWGFLKVDSRKLLEAARRDPSIARAVGPLWRDRRSSKLVKQGSQDNETDE